MQVLSSPGMLPTAQDAGGGIHDPRLAMTAPGSKPGYDAGTFSYPVTLDGPAPVPPPIAEPTQPVPAGSRPRDSVGKFTTSQGADGLWRLTPAAG